MPMNRKLLGAAAFSLALAGGGAAGALLGTPSLTLAQDGEEEPTTEEGGGPRLRRHGGEHLATAAEAIGITEDELRAALAEGQSIAQVAAANDVDVQTVVDALVAAATERLVSAIDDVPERIADVVEREGLPDRGPGRGHGPGHFGAGLDEAAEAIGITSEELRTALRDGSTIAEVAEANDVDVQAVVDAMVAAAEARLDQAVEDGRLTEAEAEEKAADLAERIGALVEGEQPPFGERPFDGPEADQDAEGSGASA